MRSRPLFILFLLAGISTFLLPAASTPARASDLPAPALPPGSQGPVPSALSQSSSCMDLLQSAAEQANVQGEISWENSGEVFNEPDRINCGITYVLQRENFETTLTQLGLNEFSDVYGVFHDGVCRYPDEVATDISYLFDFHGYYALMETFVDERTYPDENGGTVHQESRTISWYMDGGGEYCAHLSVRTYMPNVEAYGHAQDPTPIAEVLLANAEANLPLLAPMPDSYDPAADQPMDPLPGEDPLPGDIPGQQDGIFTPGEQNPGQHGSPSDPETDNTYNNIYNIPGPVVLGSFGVPVVGAAAGAIAATLMGALSKATSSASGSSSGKSTGSSGTSKMKEPDDSSSTGQLLEAKTGSIRSEISPGDTPEDSPPGVEQPPAEQTPAEGHADESNAGEGNAEEKHSQNPSADQPPRLGRSPRDIIRTIRRNRILRRIRVRRTIQTRRVDRVMRNLKTRRRKRIMKKYRTRRTNRIARKNLARSSNRSRGKEILRKQRARRTKRITRKYISRH